MAVQHTYRYLDLSLGLEREGQFWSSVPLVTGRDAVWVISDGSPVHIHKMAARNRDTRRALDRPRQDWPKVEWITGVTTPYGTRHDLTRA
jgi:hypothetical protein